MAEPIRILILEDSIVDAQLIEFELQEAGLVFTPNLVKTQHEFIQALQDFSPNIILSDYSISPTYNGSMALEQAKRARPDIPFILVSGHVTEDLAIEILAHGATDYVLKHRLQQRLGPAVQSDAWQWR